MPFSSEIDHMHVTGRSCDITSRRTRTVQMQKERYLTVLVPREGYRPAEPEMEILGGQEGLYDNALMGILQNCGKLPPFMDAIFSFLARRTDFYIIMQHERARMGFPPGVAESMVMQVSGFYLQLALCTRPRPHQGHLSPK